MKLTIYKIIKLMKFDVLVVSNAQHFSLIRSCTIKHYGTDTSFLLEDGETRKTNKGGGGGRGFSTTWFH